MATNDDDKLALTVMTVANQALNLHESQLNNEQILHYVVCLHGR